MKLLIIRHAIAEEARPGQADAERALTPEGRDKMERIVQGLRTQLDAPVHLFSSPLSRARETARIVRRGLGCRDAQVLDFLEPGTPPELVLAWLEDQVDMGIYALVGHEPDLGALITYTLTGHPLSATPLKKGGCALIEFEHGIIPGNGRLRWLLTPKQLVALGKGAA